MKENAERLREWTGSRKVLLSFVLIAVVFRSFRLGEEAFNQGEVALLEYARSSGVPTATSVFTTRFDLPLYYVVHDVWLSLVGVSEAAARIPSVAFGVLAVVAAVMFGRTCYDERTGYIFGLVMAINPYLITQSQVVGSGSLLTLLAIASWWLLLRAKSLRTRRSGIFYVATTGLLGVTHVYGLLIVLVQVLYFGWLIVFSRDDDPNYLLWAGAGALAALLFSVLFVVVNVLLTDGFGIPLRSSGGDSMITIGSALITNSSTGFTELLTILGGTLVLAPFVFLDWGERSGDVLVLVLIGAPFALTVLFAHLIGTFTGIGAISLLVRPAPDVLFLITAGIFGAVVPGILLLISRGISLLGGRTTLVVVFVLLAMSTPQVASVYSQETPPWNEVVEFLDGRVSEGDLVILVSQSQGTPGEFYLRSLPSEVRAVSTTELRDSAAQYRRPGTVWLISERDLTGAILQQFDEDSPAKTPWAIGSVLAYKFESSGSVNRTIPEATASGYSSLEQFIPSQAELFNSGQSGQPITVAERLSNYRLK